MRCFCIALAILAVNSTTNATAGSLTYTPVNPSFGGNPFNSSHLMGIANAENQHKPSPTGPSAPLTASERFAQQLQSQLYAGLAQKVSNAIFGTNAQNSGTFVFGDQKITFINDGTNVTLTILNTTTGESTEISVPSASLAAP